MRSRQRFSAPTDGGAADFAGLAAEWSTLTGRLVDRLTHEIRNPLNGAMVNLQVVSSRAARAGQDAAAVESFAASAAAELERAAALIESLLVALRPLPRSSETDVAAMLNSLVPLYKAVVTRDGGSLECDVGDAPPRDALAALDPDAVRVALAGALDAATRDGGELSARVERTSSGIVARLHRAGGIRLMAPELSRKLEQVGITGDGSADDFALHFPAVGAGES